MKKVSAKVAAARRAGAELVAGTELGHLGVNGSEVACWCRLCKPGEVVKFTAVGQVFDRAADRDASIMKGRQAVAEELLRGHLRGAHGVRHAQWNDAGELVKVPAPVPPVPLEPAVQTAASVADHMRGWSEGRIAVFLDALSEANIDVLLTPVSDAFDKVHDAERALRAAAAELAAAEQVLAAEAAADWNPEELRQAVEIALGFPVAGNAGSYPVRGEVHPAHAVRTEDATTEDLRVDTTDGVAVLTLRRRRAPESHGWLHIYSAVWFVDGAAQMRDDLTRQEAVDFMRQWWKARGASVWGSTLCWLALLK